MTTVELIGVPSSMGAFVPGQEQAPQALRAAGLGARLVEAGFELIDQGDPPTRRWFPDRENPRAQHVEAAAEVATEVAERVRAATDAGRFPLVIGGDCTIGLGTIAGFREGPQLGLVYFDLHTDMNVPSSVDEGALDWMGMAHALGFEGADPRLVSFGPRTPLLDPDEVVFFAVGPGHPTAFEHEQQAAHGLRLVPSTDVAASPEHAAGEALTLLPKAERILVHFDVDTVDFMDLPLSEDAPRNDGLGFDVAMRALARLAADPRFAALTVTEANPDHDPDGTAVVRLIDGIVGAMARATGPAQPTSTRSVTQIPATTADSR